MIEPEEMLRLKKCWAILVLGPHLDQPRLPHKCRVFPTFEDAMKVYVEQGGVESNWGYTRTTQTALPTGIYECDLPHCWMYDTSAEGPEYYRLRFPLQGRLVHKHS